MRKVGCFSFDVLLPVSLTQICDYYANEYRKFMNFEIKPTIESFRLLYNTVQASTND